MQAATKVRREEAQPTRWSTNPPPHCRIDLRVNLLPTRLLRVSGAFRSEWRPRQRVSPWENVGCAMSALGRGRHSSALVSAAKASFSDSSYKRRRGGVRILPFERVEDVPKLCRYGPALAPFVSIHMRLDPPAELLE